MIEKHGTKRRSTRSYTVQIRKKGQATLPKEVQTALHVKEGDRIRFNIGEDGEVTAEGIVEIPADQSWFWTPEWQAGEREADEQIAAGGGKVFHDLDEMFEHLNRER